MNTSGIYIFFCPTTHARTDFSRLFFPSPEGVNPNPLRTSCLLANAWGQISLQEAHESRGNGRPRHCEPALFCPQRLSGFGGLPQCGEARREGDRCSARAAALLGAAVTELLNKLLARRVRGAQDRRGCRRRGVENTRQTRATAHTAWATAHTASAWATAHARWLYSPDGVGQQPTFSGHEVAAARG